MSDMKLSEAPMKLPSVVTIPRDKWLIADYGRTSAGHCAMGWLAFEMSGSHAHNPDLHVAAGWIRCIVGTHPRLFTTADDWAARVIRASDNRDEERLRELFAERGIQLRFVGEYTSEAQSSALVPRSAEKEDDMAFAMVTK